MTQLSDEEIIAALRAVNVPEPSPLFWDHLSQRVREAVANEPPPARGWTSRFNLAWSAGVFGVIAVGVLAVAVTTHHPVPAAIHQPADMDMPALDDDPSWAVMGDLASQLDFDEAGAAGLIAIPGSANTAVGQLSQNEQRIAVELLQQEIKSSKRL